MRTRQKEDPDATIKYLVNGAKGEFVIEVPAGWKITFGAVNPAGGNGAGRYGDLHCVRVWEGEKLRAVFADVRSFRDLSIPLARKVQRETGSAEWAMDSEGNFDRRESRQLAESWTVDGFDGDDDDDQVIDDTRLPF